MELEFIVIGFHDGEEGGDWWSDGGGLLQLPYDVEVGVFEGGERGEEYFPLHVLEVRVGGGVRCSKEQGVPRDLGGVACRKN